MVPLKRSKILSSMDFKQKFYLYDCNKQRVYLAWSQRSILNEFNSWDALYISKMPVYAGVYFASREKIFSVALLQ